eukprot:7295921-Pyramimonas_sp.AAC.1
MPLRVRLLAKRREPCGRRGGVNRPPRSRRDRRGSSCSPATPVCVAGSRAAGRRRARGGGGARGRPVVAARRRRKG